MTFKKSILKKDIVIIIPAKNEYYNLIRLLNSLKKYKIDQLIIDDNSTDNTNKIKNLFSKVKIIKNKTSYGYDKSIKKGLRIAKLNYKYAITMDADFEHEGKIKMLIQTTKWLTWLKENDDDDEEEEEEDEDEED